MPKTTTIPHDEAVSAYAAGDTIEALAHRYGITYATMREDLQRWGAVMRRTGPPRKYTLNEAYFDSIDTEEKAYWLGFLLADGNVTRRRGGSLVFQVALAARDAGHLVKLAAALGSNATIGRRVQDLGSIRAMNARRGGRGAVQPAASTINHSVYLQIGSSKLCRALGELEVYPRKSTVHGTPAIPAPLLQHMYRGYFDGDGALYPTPTNHSWRWEVVGSPGFVAGVRAWFVAAGLPPGYWLIRGKIAYLRYSGARRIERVCDILYANAAVWLDRKYAMYQQLKARKKSYGRQKAVVVS